LSKLKYIGVPICVLILHVNIGHFYEFYYVKEILEGIIAGKFDINHSQYVIVFEFLALNF
jgi:hypothetical protein